MLSNYSDLIYGEVIITSHINDLKVAVYPDGVVFNGAKEYSLLCVSQSTQYQYIIGGVKSNMSNNITYTLDNDASGDVGAEDAIGYGKYRIDFYENDVLMNFCYVDYSDSDFPYQINQGFLADIHIDYYSAIDIRIWQTNIQLPIDKIIRIWDQRALNPAAYKEPNKNGFTSSIDFTEYPVNATLYGAVAHIDAGDLFLYLQILNDVSMNTESEFIVKKKSYLQISSGKIFNLTTPSFGNIYLSIQDSAFLNLESNSKLIVESENKLVLKNKSNLIKQTNSEIRLKGGSIFCNEGARIVGTGSIIFENGYHQYNCAELADFLFQDSTRIVLEDSAVVEIPDNINFHLTGINTSLIMNPNSKIKFGESAKILCDNGAKIIARNATFTSLDTSKSWEGIVLQNSGEDSVINCTFSNAKNSLALINTPGHTFYSRVIKGNVFNVPSGDVESNGIYGENNFRITVQDNVFNMSANPSNRIFGVYLKNNNTTGVESLPDENEGPAIPFSMFLINNTFNNGTASAMLLNYTSSYLPFYVKGNIFNSASTVGFIGRNITGSVKDNVFSNSGSIIPMGIHLIASSPDFYNNAISSENVSLHTIGSSFPNLSPLVSGSSLLWKGGKNRFYSNQSDKIQLVNAGNVNTNLGENRFTVSDTSENRYHIFGRVDTTMQLYTSKINCWYPSGNPRICLKGKDTSEALMTGTGLTNIDCDREISANDLITEYLGNGVYDTIKQSPDTTGSELTEEEQLYNQGQNYISASLYTEGISALKNLIDNCIYFEDLPASVYDLYSCYEYLDTTEEQSYRNTLYGNLKIYLDDKINSEEGYDGEFISNAYNITLMCDANMLNYDDAANGYEFISLFHPDPDIRLNASWDYAEIEALMGGGYGGGEKQLQITNDELREKQFQITNYELRVEEIDELGEIQEINEIKRIEEVISNDPVMMKVKEVYDKTIKERSERNERTGKQINENINTKENSVLSEQSIIERVSDKYKNEKARRNIFELKNLNRQELEKRRVEDMLLSAQDSRSAEFENDETVSIPAEFKLYQNYPNPFNPSTKINFSIPKSGIVTLRIYDILGKEVATLVNENLSPGKYTVKFNGGNLSSGVYFCRMESGEFKEIKRMVLIK